MEGHFGDGLYGYPDVESPWCRAQHRAVETNGEAATRRGRLRAPGLLWRLVFSLVLVLMTFNPTGVSYYHWLAREFPSLGPATVIVGILLPIAWMFFVKSTLAAMNTIGVGLLLALFAAIVWWMVSHGWLDLDSPPAVAWVVLCVPGLVLGIGMSWAHIRREISGQSSVDPGRHLIGAVPSVSSSPTGPA
jgi:hypothetical protein